jgi:hypothetical protein
MTITDAEPVDLAAITDHLADRHPHLPRAMIELEVSDAARSFDGAVVRDYLGVLIERQARERLLAHPVD